MITQQLAVKLTALGQTLATVESCTGGGIAARCTDLAGSSAWFTGGLVTYSNRMKETLGVSAEALQTHGAVSEPVARQMATAGRDYCNSDWAVAVTGIAGPDGGSAEKPVGTVWLAWAGPQGCISERHHFGGDRAAVRAQTIETVLARLLELLD